MSGRGEGAWPAVEGRARARRWLWLPILLLVLAATPALITRVKVHQLREKELALTEAKPKRMSGRTIPLCAGLTIVTAVSQPAGDYESIKTIESVTPDAVRLRYSSEHMVSDLFDAPRFERQVTHRTILRDDLRSAKLYLYDFYGLLPETIPGTTAIGTSTAVLQALETSGKIEFGVFQGFNGAPTLDRNDHPNVYDFMLPDTLRRVGSTPVMIPVLVDAAPAELPAIRAFATFTWNSDEFYFLDNLDNPISLEFHLGVGAAIPMSEEEAKSVAMPAVKPGSDLAVVQVTKIGTRCTDRQSLGGAGLQSTLERTLANHDPADIYDIHFTFNSDSIRAESEPRLAEIADVLLRHPDWKLVVQGHTDSIGDDASNLRLSEQRAAALKAALVDRYAIAPGRLTTEGYGRTRPRDTNATLKGRARNRRVELVRQ